MKIPLSDYRSCHSLQNKTIATNNSGFVPPTSTGSKQLGAHNARNSLVGVIVGSALGGVAVALGLIGVVFALRRRARRRLQRTVQRISFADSIDEDRFRPLPYADMAGEEEDTVPDLPLTDTYRLVQRPPISPTKEREAGLSTGPRQLSSRFSDDQGRETSTMSLPETDVVVELRAQVRALRHAIQMQRLEQHSDSSTELPPYSS